jgi:flagellar hook-basal body complex protein FliE
MSIEAIAAVGAQSGVLSAAPSVALTPIDTSGLSVGAAGEGAFDQLVASLTQIDAGMQSSANAATELALGQSDNLHQVMIGAEQTRLQFELAMSMRNRVLEAYQEIMRMQV